MQIKKNRKGGYDIRGVSPHALNMHVLTEPLRKDILRLLLRRHPRCSQCDKFAYWIYKRDQAFASEILLCDKHVTLNQSKCQLIEDADIWRRVIKALIEVEKTAP